MSLAQITPEEWRNHLELEGRVLGENHRLAKATGLLTDQVTKLTAVVDKLERRLNKTECRTDSLVDEAEVEDKVAAIIRKRFRALRGWLGWGVATALGLLKLYDYAIQHGWLH